MKSENGTPTNYGLENHGLRHLKDVYWRLTTPPLIEQAIARGEGQVAKDGGFVVKTGEHTGRSA
ncbi:MAG: phosphoenolpyruvate carboxykinase (ATP), partial [Chloroflexota bacterium]